MIIKNKKEKTLGNNYASIILYGKLCARCFTENA